MLPDAYLYTPTGTSHVGAQIPHENLTTTPSVTALCNWLFGGAKLRVIGSVVIASLRQVSDDGAGGEGG